MRHANNHDPRSQEVAAPFAGQSVASSQINVLIADDNVTNRKLLRTVLEYAGHAVFEADNGVTALKFLEQRRVDAVISDILMPGMDGFRLCFEIRRNPKLRKLPFIVYTASYTSASDEKLAMQFGADRFIRKPASANSIVETLHEVVKSVQDRDQIEVKIPEEAGVMRAYSQVLVSKLEQTIVNLSEANKTLAERTSLAEYAMAVSTALSQCTNLEEMLRECCAVTVNHLDAAYAQIWTLNERQQMLELRASAGMDSHTNGAHARIPLGQSNIGLIAAERKAHLTNAVIGDSRVQDQEWAKREGMIAFAGYPLVIADQLVGVMATFARTPFSPNTLEIMSSVARSIAVGIQRQFAENEVRRSEERFRDLAENINEIFFVAEPNAGPVNYISPAYEAITGQERAALYQDPRAWLASIHPDDRRRVERAFRNSSESLDEEYRIVRSDGEIRWLHSRAFAVKNEQGKVARIVGIATDITEQKRAEAKVTQHLDRIRALHEIDVAINSTLDLDIVLQVLLEKIDLFIPYPSVTTVRLLNPETGQFEFLACRNMDAAEWMNEFIAGSQGRARRVLETKAPVTVRNLPTDPSTHNPGFYRRHGLISYASLPLVVRDEAIGVFNLYTKEEHEFTAEEIEFLLMLAGQAAIAINNARLYEHTQRHLRRIQGVSEINTAIASSLSLKNVLDVLLEKTELFCPVAVACGARLFDEATGNMVPLASRHIPFEEWKQEVASAKGRLTRLLIETKRPVAILNMHTDSRTSMTQFARRHGLVSYLGVPLIVKDKFIGNLVIYTKKEHAFTSEEIEFFSNLGDQAAIAIHNAQLYEEARAREAQLHDSNRMLSALHSVGAATSRSLDLDEILRSAIEQVIDIFSFDATHIHIYDPQKGALIMRASFQTDAARFGPAQSFKRGRGIVGAVLESGSALVFEDVQNDARYQQLSRTKVSARSGYGFFAVWPIKSREKTLGTLTCVGEAARKLTLAETQLVEAITDRIAVALENSSLYQDVREKVHELEKANKVKGEFLSVMSHELRTPLSVIIGYSGMLSQKQLGLLTAEQDQAVEVIQRNSYEFAAMIESIMDATKIEAGSMIAEKDLISLPALLDEIRLAYDFPRGKNLRLEWRFADAPPVMWTDARKMRQILTNLINNAIKFTHQGHVVTSARQIFEPGAGADERWIEFEVADSGVGIPPAEWERIFERFHQIDSSGTRRFEGVGLGLYIVKSFSELLGGRVSVRSEVGKGSTFTVRLPMLTPS